MTKGKGGVMETLFNVLETTALVAIGLTIRFLLLIAGIVLLAAVSAPLAYGAIGIRKLWLAFAVQRVNGLRWRARTYYTPAHEWIRERFGRLRVGLDDVAAQLVARTDALTLPVPGTRLKRGDPLLTLGQGASRLTLRAPVDGTVWRVNPWIVNHPSAMRTDPYRRGWLVELSTSDKTYQELLHDEPAKAWFASEAGKLSKALRREEPGALVHRFLAA